MTIREIIDLAIDRGAKHLCLSPKQFNTIKRCLRVRGGKPMYRGAVISKWKQE